MFEKFVVHSDHAALHWLLTVSDPSGRLMRWRLRLAKYDFEVKYKPDKANTQADALSPLRTDASTVSDHDMEDIPAFLLNEENVEDEGVLDIIDFEHDIIISN